MEKVTKWQPIDTVPDGDEGFLVWDEDVETCYAVYKTNGHWYDHRNGVNIDEESEVFSHWMPFPEGPK